MIFTSHFSKMDLWEPWKAHLVNYLLYHHSQVYPDYILLSNSRIALIWNLIFQNGIFALLKNKKDRH